MRDAESGRIARYFQPDADHWLGTDHGGRDTYSRMVYAARRSLFIGMWALTFATVIGTTVGVVSAYFRGWLDTVLFVPDLPPGEHAVLVRDAAGAALARFRVE